VAQDAKSHKDWAVRCEAFYKKLGGAKCADPEWALTVLFYVCVHEVQAFLVSKRKELAAIPVGLPLTHMQRSELLAKRWKKLGVLYDQFLDWSKQARYDLWIPEEEDLKAAEELLRRIRKQIASYK
jgi:hypothetical protein